MPAVTASYHWPAARAGAWAPSRPARPATRSSCPAGAGTSTPAGGISVLPDYRPVPTAAEELYDWWELLDDQRWAKADVAHASSLLRHVFENRGEARHWGAGYGSRS